MDDASVGGIFPGGVPASERAPMRDLSIRGTFLLKFVLPPVWIGLAGYAAWQLWSRPETVLDAGGIGAVVLKWFLLVLLALSLVVLLAFVLPLKRVRLAPDGLRVSNYLREITVPFGAIAGIRQGWLPTFRLIALDLRAETSLGRRVLFLPAGPPRIAFWRAAYRREDDLVGELRQLANLTG